MGQTPWRVGRKIGRTIYDRHDQLLGVMDTPELAAMVVAAVNGAQQTTDETERGCVE